VQLIPAIDVLGNDAVRLDQGRYDHVLFRAPLEEFVGAVVNTKPDLLHVVDLDAARSGVFRPEIVARVAAASAGIPTQLSGGIRSAQRAREVLAAGARRVLIGTAAFVEPNALEPFVAACGDALGVAIDVADGRVKVAGWLRDSGLSAEEAVARCRDAGVTRVHVTAISRDGTGEGPDFSLYASLVNAGVEVVAAGGVRDDADVARLAELGCFGAVQGRALAERLGYLSATSRPH